ncbi:DUF488 domain-containing protein [Castellaniella sp.]|uniref:DUF488 domain-containing protein n=1 Tax=Castellaniella sp. TaxID=1955812 RepID=UPI00355E442F
MANTIHIKRAYEAPDDTDGLRVLVDRLWPRGLSKATFRYDLWCKDLAPSTALRTWFGHKPQRWDGFRQDYLKELQTPEVQQRLKMLLDQAGDRSLTLLYAARDTEHNQAVVLADVLRTLQA